MRLGKWGPVLFFFIFLGCRGKTDAVSSSSWKDLPEEKPPVAVEAVRVQRGELWDSVRVTGLISGGNEAYAVIEGRGIIQDVSFALGDYVEAGDILVEIDDRLPRSNYQLARQQLKTAELDFQAAEKSFENGGLSRIDYNRAESRLITAQVAADQALKALEDCTLRSPISGYVAGKDPSVSLGNLASPGVRAAYIVDTSSYRMEFSVGENLILLLEPGIEATVTLSDGSYVVSDSAVLSAVAAGSDPSTGRYDAVLTWTDSPNAVRPGMSAEASLHLENGDRSLLLPAAAVLQDNSRPFVFKAQEGRAAATEVRTGKRLGTIVEILDGLEEGDVVILTGLSYLVENQSVDVTVLEGDF